MKRSVRRVATAILTGLAFFGLTAAPAAAAMWGDNRTRLLLRRP